MATQLDYDVPELSDASFSGAKDYAELEGVELKPAIVGTKELSNAADEVLRLIETTRSYLNNKDGKNAVSVGDPNRMAEVSQELKAEYLDSNVVDNPLVKELAVLFMGASKDSVQQSRLDEIDTLGKSQQDSVSTEMKGLKLSRAKYLDSLHDIHDKYPDLGRAQLEDWLARASGDLNYAKRRISGLATEIATYDALLDMPEITSIRRGTPEEDVLGGDFIVDLNDGRRGVLLDVKSERPKDADARIRLFNDGLNGNFRVWLPTGNGDQGQDNRRSDRAKSFVKIVGFAWSNPEGVRSYYRDLVFKL